MLVNTWTTFIFCYWQYKEVQSFILIISDETKQSFTLQPNNCTLGHLLYENKNMLMSKPVQ